MATNPVNPMGPLYQRLDRVLAEQRVHDLNILREAGADVYVETDDGGAATVVHDPQQEELFGSVARAEKLMLMLESHDLTGILHWMLNVETKIELLHMRLNGTKSDDSIEDLRERMHRPGNPFR